MTNQERCEKIELSLRKKYKKPIWKKFTRALNEYDLIQENDRIAVCISGGKDSMLMAKCFQELVRHRKFHFELVFLTMDPGYNQENYDHVLKNADILGIPLTVFKTDIFDYVAEQDGSPCYLCARMRRGYLYSQAQQHGCNKIALGHHYDDVIETILMSMLYGAEIRTMMPKLHSTNFEGMELIRPMYLIHEQDIRAWCRYNDLQFIQCACRFTEMCSTDGSNKTSKRREMKELVEQFRKISPYIEKNIFRSMDNINLGAVTGYRDQQGIRHSFLDDYDDLI